MNNRIVYITTLLIFILYMLSCNGKNEIKILSKNEFMQLNDEAKVDYYMSLFPRYRPSPPHKYLDYIYVSMDDDKLERILLKKFTYSQKYNKPSLIIVIETISDYSIDRKIKNDELKKILFNSYSNIENEYYKNRILMILCRTYFPWSKREEIYKKLRDIEFDTKKQNPTLSYESFVNLYIQRQNKYLSSMLVDVRVKK